MLGILAPIPGSAKCETREDVSYFRKMPVAYQMPLEPRRMS